MKQLAALVSLFCALQVTAQKKFVPELEMYTVLSSQSASYPYAITDVIPYNGGAFLFGGVRKAAVYTEPGTSYAYIIDTVHDMLEFTNGQWKKGPLVNPPPSDRGITVSYPNVYGKQFRFSAFSPIATLLNVTTNTFEPFTSVPFDATGYASYAFALGNNEALFLAPQNGGFSMFYGQQYRFAALINVQTNVIRHTSQGGGEGLTTAPIYAFENSNQIWVCANTNNGVARIHAFPKDPTATAWIDNVIPPVPILGRSVRGAAWLNSKLYIVVETQDLKLALFRYANSAWKQLAIMEPKSLSIPLKIVKGIVMHDNKLTIGANVTKVNGKNTSGIFFFDETADTCVDLTPSMTGPLSDINNIYGLYATNANDLYLYSYVGLEGVGLSSQTLFKYRALNRPPVVNAGPDVTVSASTVTLQGTATDPDGDPMTYLWTQKAGQQTTISNSTSLTGASVTLSAAGRYEFTLTATDSKGATSFDDVVINVTVATSVPQVVSLGLVKIYPNPAKGMLWCKGVEEIVSVTSVTGMQMPLRVRRSNDLQTLDMSSFPSGWYVLSFMYQKKIVRASVLVLQ